MKNSFKIYLIVPMLFAVLVTASSCEDFLTQMPDDAIPENEAMTNLEEATQVIYGVYSAFRNPALYSGGLTTLPDLQADYMYAAEGYGNVYGDVFDWSFRAEQGNITNVYSSLYNVIYRTDYFFNYLPGVKATLTTEADQLALDKCIGDAYMARALCYSELIKLFCQAYDPATAADQLGVAFSMGYTEKGQQPKRENLMESYKRVLNDLDSATLYIPISRKGASHPFFTQGAVNALKARVKLYMQDWQGAVDAATLVIDNTDYALMGANTVSYVANMNDYQYMWTYDEGEEIIWKVQMKPNELGGSLGGIFMGQLSPNYYLPDYVPAQWVIDLYSGNDARARSIFRQIQTGHTTALAWPLLFKFPGNPDLDNGGRPQFINMPKVFRLSETYLIRAEAYYRLNKAALASQDLTTLMKKRIVDFGSVSSSGDALFKVIKEERTRELYMEGFRLADLKRWGEGFTRHPQLGSLKGPDALVIDKSNVRFTWPIPRHELDANDNIQPNPSN